MTTLIASLYGTETVGFFDCSILPNPTENPPSTQQAEKSEEKPPRKIKLSSQHGRSQSLTTLPRGVLLNIPRTPGATTNQEIVFGTLRGTLTAEPEITEPEQADNDRPIHRTKSTASLQSLTALEVPGSVWGVNPFLEQPKSRARALPQDGVIEKSKSKLIISDLAKSGESAVAITRKQKKELEYTCHNYEVQLTAIGNAGLYAAINACSSAKVLQHRTWVGTLGMPTDALTQEVKDHIEDTLATQQDESLVVWVDDTEMNGHYENYCKLILWPMLHSQVPDTPLSKAYQDDSWKYYESVNQKFADRIVSAWKEGDIVWIHDYHLMLVPNMVREKLGRLVKIGFYLHSAFPPSEIFRNLPNRKELVLEMLGANLVAFQTEAYSYQFLSTCSRFLNIETTEHGVVLEDGRFIDVCNTPIGLDTKWMEKRISLQEAGIRKALKDIKARYTSKRIIISRDKVDQIHGVKHKLMAFREFLRNYPEWADKIVLVQVATTSNHERELQDIITNLIAEINTEFGTWDWQPVVWLTLDIEYAQYLALLTLADCMLVTSLSEGHAPLILSEFTGAATVFGDAALQVNPWDIYTTAANIDKALKMTEEERKQRWSKLYATVKQHGAIEWFNENMKQLEHAWTDHAGREHTMVPRLQICGLGKQYAAAQKRVIVLDFEGTLTPWTNPSELAVVPKRIVDVLKDLPADEKNMVYVMSARETEDLDHMFRMVPRLGLIAENGAMLQHPVEKSWFFTVQLAGFEDENDWWDGIEKILEYYATRIPGSQ
ncbi:Trehalose-6-P synthase/phosphatase complex subunit, partial [Elasticomyces elasticus]